MMPTCSAPSSVQQNSHDLRLSQRCDNRKNWLFSNSQSGATASANLYSLIETAKANTRELYQYLSWLFERIPVTKPADYASLMPWHMPLVPETCS